MDHAVYYALLASSPFFINKFLFATPDLHADINIEPHINSNLEWIVISINLFQQLANDLKQLTLICSTYASIVKKTLNSLRICSGTETELYHLINFI